MRFLAKMVRFRLQISVLLLTFLCFVIIQQAYGRKEVEEVGQPSSFAQVVSNNLRTKRGTEDNVAPVQANVNGGHNRASWKPESLGIADPDTPKPTKKPISVKPPTTAPEAQDSLEATTAAPEAEFDMTAAPEAEYETTAVPEAEVEITAAPEAEVETTAAPEAEVETTNDPEVIGATTIIPDTDNENADGIDAAFISEVSNIVGEIEESIHSAQGMHGHGNEHETGPIDPMPPVKDDSIPIPLYNSPSMDPKTFITEAEEYLTMQEVPKAEWHKAAGHFFYVNSDQEEWYYSQRAGMKSWSTFKSKFIVYETPELKMDILTQQLYTRRQARREAFESFAWRIYAMYKRVDPKAKDKDIINRILHACIPRIAEALRPLKPATFAGLLKMARKVLRNMNLVRHDDHLPGYRIRKSDHRKR